MKILHISDLHIGKYLNGFSLLEDQEYFLDSIFNFIKENNIDVLLIAGDLFDRSVPPAEAVKLLDDFFYKVVTDAKIQIFAISGNHDSRERLSYGSRFSHDSGVFTGAIPSKTIERYTVMDEHGNVNIYLLPYIIPADVKGFYETEDITSFNEAYKKLLEDEENKINEEERNIILAHGFFANTSSSDDELIYSDSERSIGGADIVDSTLFKDFDYVALGHLHSPQKAGYDHIRYSGSILKYSVSEASQKKSMVVIELLEKGNIKIETVSLEPMRDLKIVEGNLNDILQNDVSDDYVYLKLHDEEVFDGMQRARTVYKNAIGLELTEKINSEKARERLDIEKFSISELFDMFYKEYTGEELEGNRKRIITDLANKLTDQEV